MRRSTHEIAIAYFIFFKAAPRALTIPSSAPRGRFLLIIALCDLLSLLHNLRVLGGFFLTIFPALGPLPAPARELPLPSP